jgi:uncharacterized protein (TIGR02421 family)
MAVSATSPRLKQKPPAKREFSASSIDAVCRRIAQNKRVRRTLPEYGRLHIDRQLPFLCVYRKPTDRPDVGTERLVKGEASYLVAPGTSRSRKGVASLVRQVAKTLSAEFGAFLIVEIWAAPDGGRANDPAIPTVLPSFTVHAPKLAGMTQTVEALEKRLRKVKILKQGVEVEVARDSRGYPPDMRPLLTATEARQLNCSFLGLTVPPVYRDVDSEDEFPTLLRSLRRSISIALRQTFFEFTRSHTTHRPPHYHSLGRKAVVKAVWDIDRQLAEVSNSFDYLLQLTPVNSRAAWSQFRRSGFQRVPEFHYRPLPIDPSLTKRKLFGIPLERVEDPALHELFRQKQDELQRKITMLEDRDTSRFLFGSLQLFGEVEDDLLNLANDLLERTASGRSREAGRGHLRPEQFAERARQEFAHYREVWPDFSAQAVVTDEVSGLIVSHGRLLIASDTNIAASRVDALLAHEVGTHLLTYYNGRAQPFRQLYSGLADYEELQEGLAVLSEYLVGGLSRLRMRQLAARVVATKMRIEGATFVDTFRELDRTHQFSQRPAFNITMRVFRGGGLTKDIVYLRGLCRMLTYAQKDGEIEPLLVGKIAVRHIPMIRELRFRNVLKSPPVEPRYLQDPEAVERLTRLRGSTATVLDLID